MPPVVYETLRVIATVAASVPSPRPLGPRASSSARSGVPSHNATATSRAEPARLRALTTSISGVLVNPPAATSRSIVARLLYA